VASAVEYAGRWPDGSTVAEWLGVPADTVAAMVDGRELLGVSFGGALRYPTGQFVAEHNVVDGVPAFLTELARAIESPKVWSARLADPAGLTVDGERRTGRERLHAGDVDSVLIEAQRILSP